jgi:hypothetical protein
MAAEGLITLEELRTKLAGLEEARATAERELGTLKSRREKLEALEQDKEVVLETYARMAPEALDSFTPEERHQFYRMLRLRVVVQPDGTTQVSGAFTDEQGVCTLETTSPCRGHRIHSSGPAFATTLSGSSPADWIHASLIGSGAERLQFGRSGTLEGSSEMTSGNIQLGPGPDRILEALKGLLGDDPGARQRPAEEVSKELVRGGYLQEEPDPVLVAEMIEGLEAEEQSLQPDEVSEEPERLRRAVDRLMDAHQEALEVTGRALDVEADGWDERPGANERLEVALVDVRDILEGALEDARGILEGRA